MGAVGQGVGSGGYWRVDHDIKVRTKKLHGQVSVEDRGSKFELICGDNGVDLKKYVINEKRKGKNKEKSLLWLIEKDNGLYSMNMVEQNNQWLHSEFKLVRNQYLTFGKFIKIEDNGTGWRLPKKTKLKIFK